VVVSATMLVLSMWAALSQSADSAGAATSAGAAELITPSNGTPSGGGALLTTGGSSTLFTVRLPAVANCTGDSANGNYRVQSYMVPSTVDPGGLTFDSSGPKPNGTGADFRQPLYTKVGGSGYTDAQTADAVTQPGPGQIINIPTFSLDVYSSTELLPGAYNVGIACTKGPASTTQVDKFWNLQMTVVTDPTDSPTKIKWTVLASQATTEFARFVERVSSYAVPNSGVDADEVRLRFEILLNRLAKTQSNAEFLSTLTKSLDA